MLILFIKIVNDSTLQFNVESLKFVGAPFVYSLISKKRKYDCITNLLIREGCYFVNETNPRVPRKLSEQKM